MSIPSNIAEGSARQGNKEFIHFLYISLGSLSELETQLIISNNIKYISDSNFKRMMSNLDEIGRMLTGLISYMKRRMVNNK